LSRNRGHQNALLGGLISVKDNCDAIISMDADLQDDIDVIDEFIEKYYNGSPKGATYVLDFSSGVKLTSKWSETEYTFTK
ncbi:MAG: glycosyltransferase, partial [Oscillospiraceae bacterium]